MKRALSTAILVCALATTALAAPKYQRSAKLDPKLSEHVRTAEQFWSAAERETDPAKQTALWEQAATAFGDIDGDPVDVKIKREAAYAAVLAWKNALNVDPRVKAPAGGTDTSSPRALPPREVKMLAAMDRYIGYADAKDPELPGILFVKARTQWRFGQIETAIPALRSIVERFPGHEVASYSAQLVLDSYNRLQQYDQLVKYADELAKNTKLLKANLDLADLVARIQQQARRKQLEQLEKAARDDGDLDKYVAAGAGYLDLYNTDPSSTIGDELLYNAGVMYESGSSHGAAINAYLQLQKNYPNSKLVPRMNCRLARIYERLAMYDKAAEMLERYAMRYGGEKDAAQALSNAVYYRKALGDRAKAIANTSFFVRNYGLKMPREAADAMWSLTALYETTDPARAITHLQDYLKTYATKGPPERMIIAHAKIGQLHWKQSCSVPGVEGLCLKRAPSAKLTCGTGSATTFAVVARDPGKAKLALASFATAIKQYERRAGDDAGARYYYAQAKLAVADAALEPFLALAFPRDLDFEGAARVASTKRFRDWLDNKQRSGGEVTRQYESIISVTDPVGAITASARLGMLSQSFASSMLDGEVPRAVRSDAKRAAYCNAVTDVVAPLESRAVTAFSVCLEKSTELGWFSDSSRYCERELIRMRPDEFPAARELRAAPAMVSPLIDGEGPPAH